MAKKVKIEHIDLLLQTLATATGQSRDHYGFGIMSERVGGTITKKYLYESLQKQMEKAAKQEVMVLSLMPNKLDEIAKYMGYGDFDKMIEHLESPIDPTLLSCTGTYYSYVRRSIPTGAVYQSPVQITQESGKIMFILKGPDRSYRGELTLSKGCLFCLMQSEDGKSFYHVYRIAGVTSPKVLQGVFSGILTGQEPIAGRTVLIRKEEKFEEMKNEEIPVDELEKSGDKEKQYLAIYFKEFSKNNLQINKSITYRIDDLSLEQH
ncbi:hypothetical protein [Fulvivirga imtechensis]|nr:hypothetical protein [Fulvivirga imtechensis]